MGLFCGCDPSQCTLRCLQVAGLLKRKRCQTAFLGVVVAAADLFNTWSCFAPGEQKASTKTESGYSWPGCTFFYVKCFFRCRNSPKMRHSIEPFSGEPKSLIYDQYSKKISVQQSAQAVELVLRQSPNCPSTSSANTILITTD